MGKLTRFQAKLLKHGVTRVSSRSLANTLLNEVERKLGRGHLLSNPDIVHIEPTTACNLGCKMCGRSTYWTDLVENSAHMKRETFVKLRPFLRTARMAVLHGWGEPLLHPDLLWMVKVCKAEGCMVTFHTNGQLLDDKAATDLIDAGLDHLTISIDGATEESYRAARGAKLETLLANLRRVDAIKRERNTPYPRLTFKSVVMKRNLHELPRLVELAAECGVGEIELNNLIVYNPAVADQSVFDQREEVEAVHREALAHAESRGIRMFYGGVEEKDGVPACPFRAFTVTCDGTVGPCGPQRFAMGNIHDAPLRDMWNQPDLVEMRRGYARRELPEQCERCPGRTNQADDYLRPDLTYLQQTLDARRWDEARPTRPAHALDVDLGEPGPESVPASGCGREASGGCST